MEAERAGSEEDEEKHTDEEIKHETVSAVAPTHTDKSVINKMMLFPIGM